MQVARFTPTEESELVNEVHINTAEIPDFCTGQPRRRDAGSDPLDTAPAGRPGGAGREDCRQTRGQSREMKGAERMAYYRTCPLCGSNNDPGEACDCRETKKEVAPLHRERPRANAYPLPVYQPFCPKSRAEEVRPWLKS